jgi:hypothetical protein
MISERALVPKTRARGSIAVEAGLVLFPLVLAIALNLELGLRARRHGVVAWATFAFTRARALGAPAASADGEVRRLFRRALGADRGFSVDETRTEAGLSVRGHYRYPALLRFHAGQSPKHHFEVSELCRFPF